MPQTPFLQRKRQNIVRARKTMKGILVQFVDVLWTNVAQYEYTYVEERTKTFLLMVYQPAVKAW